MAAGVIEITDQNFSEAVLKSPLPVLVDFWATWCGPCLRLAPTIEAIAQEYSGKVTVGKCNSDDNQNSAIENNVMSLPTVILFVGGKPVDKVIGAVPKEKLTSMLERHVAKS